MFVCTEGKIKPIVYLGIVKNGKLLLVEYDMAPNPAKSGWWIPAPELTFGEDPQEKAKFVAQDMGIDLQELKLVEVESFVLPGGWHLIYHFIGQTNSEPNFGGNIKAARWVSSDELSDLKDIAHGQWEVNVGLKYLSLEK